jgi:hypothetical protein
MNKYLSFLVYGLVMLACIFFLVGIVAAGLASLKCLEKIDHTIDCIKCLADHKILIKITPVVSSISIVLATNFGAALGISVSKSDISGKRFSGLQSLFRPIKGLNESMPASEIFRIAACYIYIVGLVISFIFYLLDKDNCMADLIPELTKSLYGAIIGALAVLLGVPKSTSS